MLDGRLGDDAGRNSTCSALLEFEFSSGGRDKIGGSMRFGLPSDGAGSICFGVPIGPCVDVSTKLVGAVSVVPHNRPG